MNCGAVRMNVKNSFSVPLKPDLLLDLLHLAVDARDFLEAQLMDFVRRHGRRGLQLERGVVVSRTILHQLRRALRLFRRVLAVFLSHAMMLS